MEYSIFQVHSRWKYLFLQGKQHNYKEVATQNHDFHCLSSTNNFPQRRQPDQSQLISQKYPLYHLLLPRNWITVCLYVGCLIHEGNLRCQPFKLLVASSIQEDTNYCLCIIHRDIELEKIYISPFRRQHIQCSPRLWWNYSHKI